MDKWQDDRWTLPAILFARPPPAARACCLQYSLICSSVSFLCHKFLPAAQRVVTTLFSQLPWSSPFHRTSPFMASTEVILWAGQRSHPCSSFTGKSSFLGTSRWLVSQNKSCSVLLDMTNGWKQPALWSWVCLVPKALGRLLNGCVVWNSFLHVLGPASHKMQKLKRAYLLGLLWELNSEYVKCLEIGLKVCECYSQLNKWRNIN